MSFNLGYIINKLLPVKVVETNLPGSTIELGGMGSLDPFEADKAGFPDIGKADFLDDENLVVCCTSPFASGVFLVNPDTLKVKSQIHNSPIWRFDVDVVNRTVLIAGQLATTVNIISETGTVLKTFTFAKNVHDVRFNWTTSGIDPSKIWIAFDDEVRLVNASDGSTVDSITGLSGVTSVDVGDARKGGIFVGTKDGLLALDSSYNTVGKIFFNQTNIDVLRPFANSTGTYAGVSSYWNQNGSYTTQPLTMIFGDFNTGLSNLGISEGYPVAIIPTASNSVAVHPKHPNIVYLTYHNNLFKVDLRNYRPYAYTNHFGVGPNWMNDTLAAGTSEFAGTFHAPLWKRAIVKIGGDYAFEVKIRTPRTNHTNYYSPIKPVADITDSMLTPQWWDLTSSDLDKVMPVTEQFTMTANEYNLFELKLSYPTYLIEVSNADVAPHTVWNLEIIHVAE